MKKIFSLMIVLVMMLSVFTFTAEAGTNGYYDVTYEAINVASGDVTDLAVGDTFFAVVTLKNAEGFFSGGVGLNWNSSVLAPVDSNGTAATAIGKVAANRADKTWELYSDSEGEDVTVFSTTANTSFSASGFYYELANVGEFAGQDYLLSGDTTIIKVRLKVLAEGNANITAGTSKLQETKADGVVGYPTIKVSSFTVGGSTGGDKVEKAVQATTSYKTGMTGVLFTAVDGTNKGQYVVRFNGTVEAGDVKVGLKVTGVPSTNNLTITAENYYGTAATGVLK